MTRTLAARAMWVALAWLLSNPVITAPIIGPRTMDQLVDNLGALSVTITPEDCERIDAIAPPKSATMRYYDAALAVDTRPNLGRW